MLKRLETLGLITRTRSTVDERSMNVELTDAGIALRDRALAIPPAVVAPRRRPQRTRRTAPLLTRINAAAQASGALDL